MNILNLLMTAKRRNKTDCYSSCVGVSIYIYFIYACIYMYVYIYVCIREPKYFCIWEVKLSTQTSGEAGSSSCLCCIHCGKRVLLLSFLSLSYSFTPFLFLINIWPSPSSNGFAAINCGGPRVPPDEAMDCEKDRRYPCLRPFS